MSTPAPRTARAGGYAIYVLLMLVAVSAFNYMDRFLLVITLESIGRDLRLTDTQLGILAGFAFSAVYTVVGLFVARWADHGNRRNIMSIGLAFWSAMTALCAGARNFLQLAACRFGVGVGESTCTPSAHSLISDYFRSDRRATAFAVYCLGLYIGLGLGFSGGGWLNAHYGWRMAFLIAGLPGLVLAIVFRLTVREPVRGLSDVPGTDARQYSMMEVWHYLRDRPSFLAYVAGTGFFVFSGNAVEYWGATFLIRVHGLPGAEVGRMMGSLGALGGVLGIMIPALIADRLAVRDLRWYLWVSAIGGGLIIPSALLFLFNNGTHLYALYFVATIFGATYMAPVVALTQRLLPLHLRALSSAIILLSFNIIGVAGGNLVTGALSDALRSTFGVESIRYAMALTLSGSVVGVALMAYSSHRLFRDMTSGKTTST